ncbi:MAG: NAD-dependent epimerase/dehydratase family protein [Planctomycetota bacterium]
MSTRRTLLITGSSGLVGSEAVRHFAGLGWRVVGLDNNSRRDFFGPGGDTDPNLAALRRDVPDFRHVELDVRDQPGIRRLVERTAPDAVVHSAAQPSHDLARDRAHDDFATNAVGTLNLLEAARSACPEAPFAFLSTNKVYGDAPNRLPRIETETRFDFARQEDRAGISEDFSIDRSMHSLFGVSKTSADLLVQEYGRYFGLPTVCLRAGCITGPNHAGVELHGFLSWLVRCAVAGDKYTIFGHLGKQVRDQIHAYDVCTAIEHWVAAPGSGDVYNLGGGRGSNASVLECVALLEELLDRPVSVRYDPRSRVGDHICYITDLRRFRAAHPDWSLSRTLPELIEELVHAEHAAPVKALAV